MHRKKLIKLLQRYLGMNPKELRCENWNDMQQQLADEILNLRSAGIENLKHEIRMLDAQLQEAMQG